MIAPDRLRHIEAIAIGASAGGVEALLRILPALPATVRAPVFVVLHLAKARPSRLVDIFSARCALPVREPEDKEPIAPGTIYFAPPDYHLLIDGNDSNDGVAVSAHLALAADAPVNFSRPSIDVLFESVANHYGERALGIILTGGNEDGAAGLENIHCGGGIAIAQQPDTAYAAYMPAAAIQRTAVDAVLTLDALAACLGDLGNGLQTQSSTWGKP